MSLEWGESHAEEERQEHDGPAGLVDGGHVEAVAQVPGLKNNVSAFDQDGLRRVRSCQEFKKWIDG